jgi:LSU ribosomal protein L15P
MKLNEIRDNSGARLKSKRLGRGEGSGKGKTCGRGHKGQSSRSGVSINGFEGGQNPLYMRLPKRGFNNKMFETVYAEVNLGQLQKALEAKKIDAATEVTLETLKAVGLVRSNALRVKLLAKGELKTALTLVVNKASEAAVQAVEKAKGKVTQLVVSA